MWSALLLILHTNCTTVTRSFDYANPIDTPCYPLPHNSSPRDPGLVWWVWDSRWEQVGASCHHLSSGMAMKDHFAHLTILIQFRMIFNIIAITDLTAGWVRGRCTWCRPSPPWSMARTSFIMAALTSTKRWVSETRGQRLSVSVLIYCFVHHCRTQSILATFGMTKIISAVTVQEKILPSQFSSPGFTQV